MDTVVLVAWLKTVGDEVTRDEPLFVIETDKANLEIEAPASGILGQVLAQPGSEVPIRSKIAVIIAPDEIMPDGAPRSAKKDWVEPKRDSRPSPSLLPNQLPPERQNRIFASPRARRLAAQAGVTLANLTATGPQQMIVERDVQAYLAGQITPPSATPVARRIAQAAGLDLAAVTPERAGERITQADVAAALAQQTAPATDLSGFPTQERRWQELSPTRRTIARRLVEGLRTTAQITLTREVDATELVKLREKILTELSPADPRPTYTDFLVSIVARQLRQHPHLNAVAEGERFALNEEININLAMDTERGLLTPVIYQADQKGLRQLAGERAQLVKRALDGLITPAELSGGTFTLTNLGSLGVDTFTPLLNPPQVAILGVGRIHPGPAVYRGKLRLRQLMSLSLTVDHRIVDGAPAARFLADTARLIEKPYLRWL
jgi:pyruvate dehydrogenase E2 component (dihydrolipoamide acetyltransferase)